MIKTITILNIFIKNQEFLLLILLMKTIPQQDITNKKKCKQ